MFDKINELVGGHGDYQQATINDRFQILFGAMIGGLGPQQM